MLSDLEKGASQLSGRIVEGVDLGVTESTALIQKGLDLTLQDAGDNTVTSYDPVELNNWGALTIMKGSIFTQQAMWFSMIIVSLMTGSIAGAIYYFAKNPQDYSVDVISSVIKTVSVALAFLLGLYVNNAIQRWWNIVVTFEKVFGAAKKLVMMLVNLNVDSQTRHIVARRCVLSLEMLRYEQIAGKIPGKTKQEAWSHKFNELQCKDDDGNPLPKDQIPDKPFQPLLGKEGYEVLMSVPEQERSFYCWGLIAKAVKTMGQSTTTPRGEKKKKHSMALTASGEIESRVYLSLYSVVQDGCANISQLKSIANFQFPFLYVHMLAWLVHLVNFLNAVGSGVAIGLTIATAHKQEQPLDYGIIIKELLFLYIQVFLYQAFLSIGTALSFPIVPKGHGAMYRLPLMEMIDALRRTLSQLNQLGDDDIL